MAAVETFTIVGTQLLTMLGILYYLGQRIDGLGRDLRGEMATMRSELRQEIGDVQVEIATTRSELRQDIGALSSRLDAHIERHAG